MTDDFQDETGHGASSQDRLYEPLWLALIVLSSASVLLFSIYNLSLGHTTIFMHLYYFPIILLAYHYRYRGFALAALLSFAYVALVYFYDTGEPDVIFGAWLRFFAFVGVAAVVAYLAEHLIADQNALQESEKKYRSLFENMLEGFAYCRMIYDDEGKPADWIYLDVNTAFERTTGLTGIIGKRAVEAIPGIREMTPGLFDTYGRVASTGTPETFEIDFKPLGMWLDMSVFSPRKGYFVAAFEDITARKKAEVELRDASRRFADVIGFFPDPTMVVNADGTVTAWNRAMERLTGIAADSILGKGDCAYAVWFYGEPRHVLIDLVLGDDKEAIARLYPRHREYGQTIRAEIVMQRPDGTKTDFWVTATPLFNQNGESIGAIESLRDVTPQKTIARAMLESKNYLNAIINTISDPVFVKDRQYRFVTVNDGFCEFVGHTREELLGKTDYDFFGKEEADIFRRTDEEVFSSRLINENEEALTDNSGSRHTIVTKKSLHTNVDGERFIVGIIRDMSDRKQLETALLEVNKKLNLLSSITRHDINNQLFSLKAFLELSKETLDDAAKTSEYLLKAEQAANAIERQIIFTREYQELGAGNPVWQEISPFLKSSMAALPMRDIRIVDMTLGFEIFADPLFEKVFYNLIDNALRYGGLEMTEIRISSAESEGELVISVQDDGVGVSDEDKKKLFSRGFGRNTGLGLFLSREILSITGITITETGELGKGARFEIVVPAGVWRVLPV